MQRKIGVKEKKIHEWGLKPKKFEKPWSTALQWRIFRVFKVFSEHPVNTLTFPKKFFFQTFYIFCNFCNFGKKLFRSESKFY